MSNGLDAEPMDRMTVMLEIDPVTLSKRIREAREAAGLTQQQLADACGITDGTVSAWENGKAKGILADNLFAAADKMGVDPRWLATGIGTAPPARDSVREITQTLESLPEDQQEAVRRLIKSLKR